MAIEWKSLANTLKQNKELGPVVLIVGPEAFLAREMVDQILHHRYGDKIPADDVLRITGDKKTKQDHLTELFDELRTPSLFGGNRTVIIDQAEFFFKLDKIAWKNLFADPWSDTLLILKAKTLAVNTVISKGIEKVGLRVNVKKLFNRPPPWKVNAPPWEHDLNQWIVMRASTLGMQLTPPVAHLLQTRVGATLAELAGALERIATALASRDSAKRIALTEELVCKHTPDGEESGIFELVDTLFQGKPERSLSLCRQLINRGTVDASGARVSDSTALILSFSGACMKRVQQIRKIHALGSRASNDDLVAQELGMARPMVPQVRKQAQSFSPHRVEKLVEELYRADKLIKSQGTQVIEESFERLMLV